MARQQGGVTLHSGELAQLYYSDDSGANWFEIPGVMNYSEGGGAAPVRQPVTMAGVGQRRGFVRPQTVSVGGYYPAIHPAWERMQGLVLSGDTVEFKMETRRIQLLSLIGAATHQLSIGVSATGVISVARGSNPAATIPAVPLLDERYAPGQVVRLLAAAATVPIDGNVISFGTGAAQRIFRIDTVDTSKETLHEALTVRPAPAAALAVGKFGLVVEVPALRRQFRAFVSNVDVSSLQSEGDLSSPLELAAAGRLPKWRAFNPAA